jgi:hypothetical protein
MRCLYCGKELALLKRLTGGEFCSDAHRQQYKEEYNELALNRLLQAKSQPKDKEESKADPAGAKAFPSILQNAPARDESRIRAGRDRTTAHSAPEIPHSEVVAPAARYEEPLPEPEPAAKPDSEPERVTPQVAESGPVELSPEESAPAEQKGFLIDLPAPVMADVVKMAVPETDLEHDPKLSLPIRDPEVCDTQLFEAGRLTIEPSTRYRDYATRRSERGPEIREFGRSAPAIEMRWPVADDTTLDTSEEPMEILIFPHPPQGSPRLWQEPEREFEAIETELGVLARMVFRTTGIEDNSDSSDDSQDDGWNGRKEDNGDPTGDEARHDTGPAASLAAFGSFVEGSNEASVANLNGLDMFAAPAALASTTTPEVTPALELVPASEQSVPVELAPPEEPPKKRDPEPDLVTKPLPLTLHGLAAGRGKPVHLFSSAAAGFEVHLPRSGALPLRPLMTLGPALASAESARKTIEKKEPERSGGKGGAAPIHSGIDSRRSAVSRTDAHLDAPAVRKLDAPAPQSETRPLEKRANARSPIPGSPAVKEQPGLKDAPVLKEAVATETKPEKIRPESPKPLSPATARVSKEPVQESARAAAPAEHAWPAPLSAPLDLGLPSLNLKKPSGSLWSRIPMPAKIGVAVGVLAIIGVAASASVKYFSSRGPQVVAAGPALPVSGWVKDWDTGPQIQVTVLQGTSNLSDYRAQFQAQIDTKAVGWVFRARDPKNFYASKLEVVKSGAIWTAVLARFAVIDGYEEPRVHVPLSLAVQENTVYKVRLEAVGDHFSTWIQDQKVDDFADGRIQTGGVGLYSERGESALLKGDISVIPLRIKK